MEKTEMVKLGSAFSVPEMTVLGPQIIQRLEWNCTRPDDPNFKLSRVCWDCNKGFSGYLWTTWFLGIISLRGDYDQFWQKNYTTVSLNMFRCI